MRVLFLRIIAGVFLLGNIQASEIALQKLTINLPEGHQSLSESLLTGEIPEVDVEHVILAAGMRHVENMTRQSDTVYLFFKGKGVLQTAGQTFEINPESIAVPMHEEQVFIEAAIENTLHFIRIRKPQTEEDLKHMKQFPKENRAAIYFRNFEDCTPYTEKIKSPKTVSRTVLPKDHISRVAMGTVKTSGPDAVGAHEHPMLEQLFLGLEGNDITFFADKDSIQFGEFELLHVPLASSHWVEVKENKLMYYQWMDFFRTKSGEEWLKTHKHIDEEKKDKKYE